MYEIDGSGDKQTVWCSIHMLVSFVTLVLVILMYVHVTTTASGFENNDYGIGQRRDVIAAIPVYEEESLQQKVDRWSAPKSTLTGSRDPPVFFQDYDADASRKGGRAVSVAREGFEGGRDDNDLERALSGH